MRMDCFENKYCKITSIDTETFNVTYKVVYEKWFATLKVIPKEKIISCQLLEVNKNLHFQWFMIFPVFTLLFVAVGLLVGEMRPNFESDGWWLWYEGMMVLFIVFLIFVFWAYVIADGLMQKYFIGKYFDNTLGGSLEENNTGLRLL